MDGMLTSLTPTGSKWTITKNDQKNTTSPRLFLSLRLIISTFETSMCR